MPFPWCVSHVRACTLSLLPIVYLFAVVAETRKSGAAICVTALLMFLGCLGRLRSCSRVLGSVHSFGL